MRKMAYTFAAILLAAVFGLTGCGGDFDAAGYMQAVLDERLQGEFSEAAQIMDTSEFELKQDYESSVDSFVYAYLTAGYEELNDYTLYEYETLVKDIFSVMKYDVKKAEKAGEKEYEVSVEIQPVDLFLNYVKELEQASQKKKSPHLQEQASDEIEKSAKNGGYEGTEEEIREMMQYDYLSRAYSLLQDAYTSMQYGKPETVIVEVAAEDGNSYAVSEEEYQMLLEQFFRMDEIANTN